MRRRSRQEAKKQLVEIRENANRVLVIHYSCESFYDRGETESSRITSIAVRNLATEYTKSFPVHQYAELDGEIELDDHYDRLEKSMLEDFFVYAKNHENCIWLHWNMRDANYGFEALEHRLRVHGGEPFSIHEATRRNLARMLVELYGVKYIGHPRLEMLARKNEIGMLDFLNGEEEARAFDNKKYMALHRSTLRKVDIISDIAVRAADGTLATNTSRWKLNFSYFGFLMRKFGEHPLVWVLGVLGALASIVALILRLMSTKPD